MKVFFALCLGLLLAAGGFFLGLQQQWWTVPREWNPFAPLHLADPVTPLTRWKLQRLGDDPEACLTALQTAPAVLVLPVHCQVLCHVLDAFRQNGCLHRG